MKRLLLAFALGAAAAPATPAQPAMPEAASLDAYQWKNRLLLLFAPSSKAPAYDKQMQLLADQEAGLADRDMALLHVFVEGESREGARQMPPARAEALRARYEVSPNAVAFILIGKDGTAKRRSDVPIKPEVLFEQIDAMPMRQREMNERAQGGS